jgi:hypothetical protein
MENVEVRERSVPPIKMKPGKQIEDSSWKHHQLDGGLKLYTEV